MDPTLWDTAAFTLFRSLMGDDSGRGLNITGDQGGTKALRTWLIQDPQKALYKLPG